MKTEKYTYTLTDLKGVKKKLTNAIFYKKEIDVLSTLKEGTAITSADANGAFNVWMNDLGKIACESMVYCATLEYLEFEENEIVKVEKWIKKWTKRIK